LDGEDVLAMTVDSRARAGLFLAMQYPVEVPGVTVSNFLRTAVTAVRGEAPKLRDFVKELRAAMSALSMDPAFAERNLNEGFSGGEKKRHEILQLELLDPKIAVLESGNHYAAQLGVAIAGTENPYVYPDNLPRIAVNNDKIAVNGLYRHGFLLAPALAELTLGYVERGVIDNEVMQCA